MFYQSVPHRAAALGTSGFVIMPSDLFPAGVRRISVLF